MSQDGGQLSADGSPDQDDVTGTVNGDFTEMSGTYSGQYSGMWTAVRID